MKRHKLLWALVVAGVMFVAARAVIRPAALANLAHNASKAGALLAALGHWLRVAAMHVTTSQLIGAAAVAWLVFVLSLILLARSRPAGQQTPRVGAPNAADAATVQPQPPLPQPQHRAIAMPHEELPPLPPRPASHVATIKLQEAPYEEPIDLSFGDPTTLVAPVAVSEQPAAPDVPIARAAWSQDGWVANRRRSRTLALTGAALVRERALRYGVFLVAQDIGTAGTRGEASRHVVEVVAERMVPSLAGDRAMGSAQLAALLKLAVLEATLELRRQALNSGADLGAALAGMLVVGNVAYVASVRGCHAYVCRPGEGVLPLTNDQATMSRLAGMAPLEPDARDAPPPHNQSSPHMDIERAAGDLTVMAFPVYADDLLLLCSDELPRALSAPQIEALLRSMADVRGAAELLAREGTTRAGQHDFSVVVVSPRPDGTVEFGLAASGTDSP